MLRSKIKSFAVLALISVFAITLSLFGLSLDKPNAFVFAEGETTSMPNDEKETESTESNYVARIGETQFATLKEAFAAAKKGDTVTMTADYTVESVENTVEARNNVSVDTVLDLNGYTIKYPAAMSEYNKNFAVLEVIDGATLTVTDSGKTGKIISDSEGIEAGLNIGPYTINVSDGSLVINGGYYLGGGTVAQVVNGTITVNDGVFEVNPYGSPYFSDYMFNCIDGDYLDGSAKIKINGGSFKDWDPFDSKGDRKDGVNARFTTEGVGVTKDENGKYVVSSGMVAQLTDENGNSVAAFATLKEAIAAAKTGYSVVLVDDVLLDEQIEIANGITIDGQGLYEITATKKLVGANNKSGMFYRVTYAKDTLLFKDLTLNGNNVSKIFLNESGSGETVFDGVVSKNGGGIAYGAGIHISGGGSHATIKNSILTNSKGTMELSEENYYAANDLWVGGNVYVTVENSVIGYVFVNSAPTATPENNVVHGRLTIEGEETKITYISGDRDKNADKDGHTGSVITIKSGLIETIFDNGDFAISGGTFKTKIKNEWLEKGYTFYEVGDGFYGIRQCSSFENYLVNLGSSITMKIGVKEVGENVKVTYSYSGVETEAVKENGYYLIKGITPQIIDRIYTVKLYEGGEVVAVKDVSVVGYCDELLSSADGTKAKEVVTALLYYGKEAKAYRGMEESEAINAVIVKYSLTLADAEKPESSIEASGEKLVSKITLNVSDTNAIVYAMNKDAYEKVYGTENDCTVAVNGKVILKDEWAENGDLYIYTGESIYASELSEKSVLVISGKYEQTIKYGAYDYCARKWDTDGVKGLVRSLYAYAVACAGYVAK